MRILTLTLILLVVFGSRAHALCSPLTITNINTTQTYAGGAGTGFSPYDSGEYLQTVTFKVNTLVNAFCGYYVVLRTGQSGSTSQRLMSLNGNTLKYNAYTDSTKANILSDFAGANAGNVIVGSFNSFLGLFESNDHSFVWSVSPIQSALSSASFYTDPNVYLDVYEGTPGGGGLQTLHQSTALTFQAKSLSSVDISVVDTGNSFNASATNKTIAFGTPTSNAQRSFDISVRSNAGYSLTMASQYGQALRHNTLTSVTIPYSVEVNNAAANLSVPNAAVNIGQQSNVATPVLGTNLPVKVTLGTIPASQASGSYQDALTLSVSAF